MRKAIGYFARLCAKGASRRSVAGRCVAVGSTVCAPPSGGGARVSLGRYCFFATADSSSSSTRSLPKTKSSRSASFSLSKLSGSW